MRPSIAAALSTLGPLHSADTVLLAPTDVDRFADVEGPDEGNRRVVVRPDGSLLLVVEFDAPTFAEVRYALVGAVPKDAWAWADPKKRQPAPLALGVREIKLGAADLDAIANGGSATWSLGSPKIVLTADADARAALRPAPLARVNLDARDIHCLTQGGEIHRGATVGTTPTGLVALQAATSKAARIAALNHDDCVDAIRFAFTTRTPKPAAPVRPVAHATFTVDEFSSMLTEFGRTGKVTRTPKNGDTLGSFTPDGLDALPVGAAFVCADGGPLTKRADGLWYGWGSPVPSVQLRAEADEDRTLILPAAKRTPKDGDRLDSFTVAELDGLPVGARFVIDGFATYTNCASGRWGTADWPGVYDSGEVLSAGPSQRTLVLPKPAEAPKPAASPKVGDRWGALNDDQRAALPMGTVLGAIDGLTPVVKVGSGWVDVEDGGKVGGFVPGRTIAFLPVSK